MIWYECVQDQYASNTLSHTHIHTQTHTSKHLTADKMIATHTWFVCLMSCWMVAYFFFFLNCIMILVLFVVWAVFPYILPSHRHIYQSVVNCEWAQSRARTPNAIAIWTVQIMHETLFVVYDRFGTCTDRAHVQRTRFDVRFTSIGKEGDLTELFVRAFFSTSSIHLSGDYIRKLALNSVTLP